MKQTRVRIATHALHCLCEHKHTVIVHQKGPLHFDDLRLREASEVARAGFIQDTAPLALKASKANKAASRKSPFWLQTNAGPSYTSYQEKLILRHFCGDVPTAPPSENHKAQAVSLVYLGLTI